jgi:hypothetical protein
MAGTEGGLVLKSIDSGDVVEGRTRSSFWHAIKDIVNAVSNTSPMDELNFEKLFIV